MFDTIYCATVDDHIRQSRRSSEQYFSENFIRSILFDGNFAVTDAYWYGHKSIQNLPHNMLLRCLRHGVIQPWFRAPENSEGLFLSGLKSWKELGVEPVARAQDLAIYLDKHLKKSRQNYTPRTWPPPDPADSNKPLLGARVAQIVDEHVTRPEVPVDPNRQRRWDLTREWRVCCVQEAIQRTNDRTLRRGELLQVIWDRLPADGNDGSNWPKRLNNNVELMRKRIGHLGAMRTNFEAFYSWILQCYHIAQADMFETDRQFFPCSGDDQLIQLAERKQELNIIDDSNVDRLRVFTLFPRPSSLLNVDIDILLKVRADEGSAYFAELSRFRKCSTQENADNVRKALLDYATALQHRYRDLAHDPIVAVLSPDYRVTQVAACVHSALISWSLDFGPLLSLCSEVAMGAVTLIYPRLPADVRGLITHQETFQRIGPVSPLIVTCRPTGMVQKIL